MSAGAQITVRIGTRPAVDALRRLDELSEAGVVTAQDLQELWDARSPLFDCRADADGALIIHPGARLSALLARVEGR